MRQLQLIREKAYKHRKTARPISLRGANHVVLKSAHPILRRHSAAIRSAIFKTQNRFHIKIRALAIMPDHTHLIIKVTTRKQFADSLRYLAGAIALTIKGSKLWRARAWSRALRPGRDMQVAERYVWQNSFKAGCFDLRDTAFILDGVLQI